MKIQIFLSLLSLISISSISPMIQQQPAPQETIFIQPNTIAHNIRIPAGTYTRESLQNWLRQEKLNNTLWLSIAQNKPARYIVQLIAMGANIHRTYNDQRFQSHGETPLHIATANHNAELVSVLLQHSANADQKDNEGNSPLDYAIIFREFNRQYYNNEHIAKHYQKIIKLLIMCGAQDQSQKYLSIFFPPLI